MYTPLESKNVIKYNAGTNPALDSLIGRDEEVYIVNWFAGRLPLPVPLVIEDKEAWVERRYLNLYGTDRFPLGFT